MNFGLIDVTETARELGYPFPVSVENSVDADEVAQVLTAAREAVRFSAVGSFRVPFQITRVDGGVIEAVDMVMVIRVDRAGRPEATILA